MIGTQKNTITSRVLMPGFLASIHLKRKDETTLVAMPVAKEYTKNQKKYDKPSTSNMPFITFTCNSTTVRKTIIATTSDNTVSPSKMATM